jgi:RNA polymerase sigma factor (sigma-70 family)
MEMGRDARDHRSSESSWLAQWFTDHASAVMERLRGRARRKDDAEDALQQTMLSILELADHQRANVKNLSAYIYAAAVRKLAAMQAANARPYETTLFGQSTPPELSRDELLDHLHFEKLLTEDLNRLPPLHQKVFMLRGLGMTNDEIARECDLKPYKVDRILFDARTTLQPTFKGSD